MDDIQSIFQIRTTKRLSKTHAQLGQVPFSSFSDWFLFAYNVGSNFCVHKVYLKSWFFFNGVLRLVPLGFSRWSWTPEFAFLKILFVKLGAHLSGLCVGVQGRKSKGTTEILALGIGLITGDETIRNCEEDRKYG